MERRKALKIIAGISALRHTALAQPSRYTSAQQQAFMRRAAELRQQAVSAGDQPYGAVVVKDGRIVGEGPSRVVVSQDPTAHAEMEAVRDAARRLGSRDLRGCELYSTSRACKMCETAAYWAGISRMYFGSDVADAGAPTYPRC
ncbi:MAG: nucleoside deaminase [Meiothermus sp.]|nr:nucleoside deaminase [Meiothermus sp.]